MGLFRLATRVVCINPNGGDRGDEFVGNSAGPRASYFRGRDASSELRFLVARLVVGNLPAETRLLKPTSLARATDDEQGCQKEPKGGEDEMDSGLGFFAAS